ncbi:MAG: GNAT family N-acetyltransferase [Rubritalea sp.]
MIEIYDCFRDADKWRSQLGSTVDVYFTPEWLQLHVLSNGDKGRLFYYEDDGQSYIYPFIQRPIPLIYGVKGCDIESAYGYGGPLCSTDDSGFIDSARRAFEDWCTSEFVVAEFCAFHPLIGNDRWNAGDMQIFEDRQTVSMDLRNCATTEYSRDGRYMVRRAQREGIQVDELDVDQYFDSFVHLYLEGMQKMGAEAFYSFNDIYFKRLKEMVKRQGWLMAARSEGVWLAASLFIYGGHILHYHLSVKNSAHKAPGATNLILDAAAQKARTMGLKEFHLGGGRSVAESDSLFKFKMSMASRKHNFWIGKCVHQASVYKQLIDRWVVDYPELEKTYGSRILKYRIVE